MREETLRRAMKTGEGNFDSPELGPAPDNRRRRPFCERCSKPATVCICSRIKVPPIDNSIGVTILQHNLEGKHHLNSARVASIGLMHVAVVLVSDVLFQAEYTIRPLPGGSFDDPAAGLHRRSEGSLDLVSNASAFPGGVSRTASDVRSMVSNEDDDECFRTGVIDPAASWADGNGQLPDQIYREVESTHAIASNRRACSQNQLGYSENGDASVHEAKSENIADVSVSPEPQARDPSAATRACVGVTNGQPKFLSTFPDEEESTTVDTDLYKIICSASDVWISLKRTARPDLSWALSKPVVKSAASNGFSVQRLQTKGKRGGKKMGVFEEFHLLIPPGSAVLFPGKAAVDVRSVDFNVKHLILLDGTWDKARRMFYENPWLQLLPRIKLEVKAESLYKEVRHQPQPGCLSTIESIVCALKSLTSNGTEALDYLLEVFESMVADQRRLKEEKFCRISPLNTN